MYIIIKQFFVIFVILISIQCALMSSSDEENSELTYQKYLFKNPLKLKVSSNLKDTNDDKEIYYSMRNAINYLFQKIQNETTEVSISPLGDFKLEPKNIVFLQPKCEKVTEQATLDREPFLQYEDCSILIIMRQLAIKNSNRVIATFQDYLAEFSFDTLIFTLKQNNLLYLENIKEPDINYNKAESLFNIPSLSSQLNKQMIDIGKSAFSNLLYSFQNKAGTLETEHLYLEGFLGSVFNVLYMNGPFINVEETEEEKKQRTHQIK